jgi:hypothetical protein
MAERVSAREVIAEITRNMRASWEELYLHVLVPSYYQVYLHGSDFDRLEPILPRVASDAKYALDIELANLNRLRFVDRLLSRALVRYESADREWRIELFPDPDDELQPGTVRVKSQLILPPRPGVAGVTTRFNVTRSDQREDPAAPPAAAAVDLGDEVLAEFTHNVDGVPVVIPMKKNEFTIGRGGPECPVDLEIANASVSEVHVRIYRNPHGEFYIESRGRYGTTVGGADVPNGQVARLGLSARIGLARDMAVVDFRVLSSS